MICYVVSAATGYLFPCRTDE